MGGIESKELDGMYDDRDGRVGYVRDERYEQWYGNKEHDSEYIDKYWREENVTSLETSAKRSGMGPRN